MTSSIPRCLALLIALCLAVSSASININMSPELTRDLESESESDSNNYKLSTCQRCLSKGVTFLMLIYCQDAPSAAVCCLCLKNADDCNENIPNAVRLEASHSPTASGALHDSTFVCRQERERLNNHFDNQNSFHSSSYHEPRRESSAEAKSHPQHQVDKKWYSPYKYILSLFPQRLSYGHSVFLKSMLAQRPKSNSSGGKLSSAWMKKSGIHEENDWKNTELYKNPQKVVIRESAKRTGNLAIKTNSKKYSPNIPARRSKYTTWLNDGDKVASKERGVIPGLPVYVHELDDNFQTSRNVPLNNFIEKAKAKRDFISGSHLKPGENSWPDFPWMELAGKPYNSPMQVLAADLADMDQAEYFFAKLFLFVDTLKQVAEEQYQDSLGTNAD